LANPNNANIPEPSRNRLEGSGAVVGGVVATSGGATQVAEFKQLPVGRSISPLDKVKVTLVSILTSLRPPGPAT